MYTCYAVGQGGTSWNKHLFIIQPEKEMTNKRITNLPKDIKPILDRAAKKAYDVHVDIKPAGKVRREPSDLTYQEAWEIIKENSPHNTIYWRSYWEEYWEFGSCNISGEMGYYIYILVKDEEAHEIFNEFELLYEIY